MLGREHNYQIDILMRRALKSRRKLGKGLQVAICPVVKKKKKKRRARPN